MFGFLLVFPGGAFGIAADWKWCWLGRYWAVRLAEGIRTSALWASLSALLSWLIVQQQILQALACRLKAWVPALWGPSRRRLQRPMVMLLCLQLVGLFHSWACVPSPCSTPAAWGAVLWNHTLCFSLTFLPSSGGAWYCQALGLLKSSPRSLLFPCSLHHSTRVRMS